MKKYFNFLIIFFILAESSCVFGAETNLKNFLTISDIHFDPFIACQAKNKKPCKLIELLQSSAVNEWPAILQKYGKTKPQYREDTDYALFKSSLAEAKLDAEKNHVQFVIVLGDFLAHNYKQKYKKYALIADSNHYHAFVKKTMQFINNQLVATFPSIAIYNVVGNNDSYQGDYTIDPDGQFFADLNETWSKGIKNDVQRSIFRATFDKAGYYAIDLPSVNGLRLIVLNSVLFSTKADGAKIKSTAKQQLSWLHDELEKAKKKNEKVIIAMHIPTGIDVYATLRLKLFTVKELWKKKFTESFEAELKKYAPYIAGVLASHLHSDWFQILSFDNGEEVPVTGTPAISPIYGNNPGFKIYEYNTQSHLIQNYITFFYPINQLYIWQSAYDFNRTYQADCMHCSLLGGMHNVKNNLNDYLRFSDLFGRNTSYLEEKAYYWCAIYHISAKTYKNCVATF